MEFADKWLINTHNGYVKDNGEVVERIKIEDYPTVKNHLDKYYDRLVKRYDQGDTPYNLRNCAYMEDFSKQNVVWKAVGKNLTFSILEEGKFLTAPASLITSEINFYILGFLCSKFAKYFIFQNSDTTGAGDIMLNIQSLERIPIPKLDDDSIKNISNYVKQIIFLKSENRNSFKIENELNQCIYELFCFTKQETNFIENL